MRRTLSEEMRAWEEALTLSDEAFREPSSSAVSAAQSRTRASSCIAVSSRSTPYPRGLVRRGRGGVREM